MKTKSQIEESKRLAPNAQDQSGSSNNSDDETTGNPASPENSDSIAYTHTTNNATADMETETRIEESERLAPNAQEQSASSNNSDDEASSNPASPENSDSTEYTHSTNNATTDVSTVTAVDSSLPASPAASNSFLAINANSPPVYHQPATIPIEEVGYIHEETTNPRPEQNAISNSFLATNANSPPVSLQPSTIPIEEVGYNIHEETTNPRPGQNAIGSPPIQESLAWSENDERGPIVPMPV